MTIAARLGSPARGGAENVRTFKGAVMKPYCDYADDELLGEIGNLFVEISEREESIDDLQAQVKALRADLKLSLFEAAMRKHPEAWRLRQ